MSDSAMDLLQEQRQLKAQLRQEPDSQPAQQRLAKSVAAQQPLATSLTRMAPYVWHDVYWEANFSKQPSIYEDMAEDDVAENMVNVLPVLRRLEAGEKVNIAVLGGSMTGGEECEQEDFKLASCAWPARFLVWLRARYPQAEVNVLNFAKNGCNAVCALTTIGMDLTGPDKIDMVIIDTMINDLEFGCKYPAWREKLDAQQLPGGTAPPPDYRRLQQRETPWYVGYENLVRTIHEMDENLIVVGMVTVPRPSALLCSETQLRHRSILQHYGLAILDFQKVLDRDHKLWHIESSSMKATHPDWTTHQRIADALAFTWGLVWDSYSSARPWPAVLQKEMAQFDVSVCTKPTSVYSAYGRPGGREPILVNGDWRLFEDRPRKPGWIATERGSTLLFPLEFDWGLGKNHRVVIKYLRSYQSLGDVTLVLHTGNNEPNNDKLTGLWSSKDHDKTSQTDVFVWKVPVVRDLPTNITVHFLGPDKFKLIELLAC